MHNVQQQQQDLEAALAHVLVFVEYAHLLFLQELICYLNPHRNLEYYMYQET